MGNRGNRADMVPESFFFSLLLTVGLGLLVIVFHVYQCLSPESAVTCCVIKGQSKLDPQIKPGRKKKKEKKS